MNSENVLILGGTSDVGAALAARFAQSKYSITLAARDLKKLAVINSDIQIRYNVTVQSVYFDALDFASHENFYNNLSPKPEIVVCVFGLLGEQYQAQQNWQKCLSILSSNYIGAVSILNVIANDFEKRKHGVIVGISSVAGDRGRQSNYFYGSAKAGLTVYLSGLRNRLLKSSVHVLTVKPGFMKTKMIEGIRTPAPLTVSPQRAAESIYKAALAKKDVIYVLSVWRFVMFVICFIPEGIFKRLKL